MYNNDMEVIINQILIMAILIFVGYVLCKTQFINQNVTKGLSNILLRFIIPFTIIESFIQPFTTEKLKQLVIVSIISIVITFLMIFISKVFFKKDQLLEQYATIFTNKGFVGIPIVLAVFGSEAVSIITPIIVISNVFAWTYGMSLLYNEKLNLDIRKIITNPSIVGLLIGLVFFFMPFGLPYPITRSINYLTSINTPLAMMILGAYLADEQMKQVFTNKSGYQVSIVRLIIMPMIVLSIMKVLLIDPLMKSVIVIAYSVPSAANTAMFAQLTGSNYSFGAQIVSLTTILSGLSLPLMLYLMEIIL